MTATVLYRLVGIAALAYAGVVGGLYFGQRLLLYRPSNARPQLAGLAQLGVREVVLRTTDGLALLSWYLPPPAGRPVIVYFHGNGGHIGHRTGRLLRFAQGGFGVLMVEYRGYGGNPGTPSETGLGADARAALNFLQAEAIAPERVAIWGESLGSGVAVRLAGESDVAALVLEAPFTSIAETAQIHYPYVPAARLVRDRFDSLSRIGRVKAPILVMHGEHDAIVPVRYGRALLAAAPEPKEGWFSPEAGHEDLPQFGALDAAIEFLDRRLR